MDATEELKFIAGCISKLRNEVQTNKAIISLNDNALDTGVWNASIMAVTEKEGEEPKWFKTPWLYVECYMYRRIQEAVWQCKVLHELDPFEDQKKKAFTDSEEAIEVLLHYLKDLTEKTSTATEEDKEEYLREFLQIALWGNRCDLSISASQENSQTESILDQLHHLEPNILINDTDQVLRCLQSSSKNNNIDIILDNAGFELITDLCLAEILLTCGWANCIRMHGKAMPWFVSDVTSKDFQWTLSSLSTSSRPAMSYFGKLWSQRLENCSWKLTCEDFWTTPYDFAEMKTHASSLYQSFRDTKVMIFKGDLNYRKLLGDLDWNPTTPFEITLRGFHPAPLCALRACKADLIAGLAPGQKETVENQDKKWMVNGNWSVISFCGKSNQ
ncbi:damage-control phosphatase ARMT1-like isoform X2 [Ostrea edulis]|uniref:damage-control phosphatase ARMT1-like isoform X2 n=1 Tax=Ostrea edulis TaxID=37623 RepID=UPI0020948836|nr:damage-control phosphatase ARMT1-like isoform X2 [Ostrea edulis]XP_048737912.1 damage-control phosphatase ARMT1-like isoform X2 [Ostrea edulis]XP_056022737.1 damage-control phosphatase ARMT1-like isoform X2 [Ostrea edulis]